MNIHTVAENLRKTIAGKERYLAEMQENYRLSTMAEGMALTATIEFLKININELKVILFDVEKCCEKATLDSWRENPDRSGGQFTQDEVDNAGKW
jgi:hypothetical protein